MVVVSILAGYGAALAERHYQGASDRERLLAEAAGAVELAEARVGLVEAQVTELRKKVETGVLPNTTLAAYETELSLVRRELERARLERDEVEASGQPVRTQLSSPLVAGRDFVSERLRLEIQDRQDRLQRCRADQQQAERNFAAGVNDGRQIEQMRYEVSLLESEVREAEYELELRVSYLAGKRAAHELAPLSQISRARARLEAAAAKRERARAAADWARKSFANGTLPPLDVKAAEFELTATEVEERLARVEVEHLERQRQKPN
jgi:hypothetical protein